MLFQFNFFSSLLLIFFVHILVYAIMLWRRGLLQDSTSDKLLGSFLVVADLSVIPWMVGFAGWYDEPARFYKEILFYTPFVHGLFTGPLLYFYVKSLTNFKFRFKKTDWLHFLPGLLYLIWTIIVVVVDKLLLKKYYLMNGQTDPDFDLWYQILQKISIIVYLVLAIRYYKKYRRYVFFEMSFFEAASLKWLRNFLVAFGIMTLLPWLLDVLDQFEFFRELDYKGSWFYFFSYALVVYYIAINGYNATSIPLRRLDFLPELLINYEPPKLLTAPQSVTEDASFEVVEETVVKNEDEFLTAWKAKLSNFLETDKVYEEPELTLSELARRLSTNTSVLSKVVNQGFGMSFNDYINQFRVNAVINLLKKGEHKKQTLLGIAFDCGFNSKATFNRAFKKMTGLSPKDWLSQNPV